MLTQKQPYNQTRSEDSPGSYYETWKPIFAWHIGDVLQHAEMDLELNIDQVTAFLESLDEESRREIDALIDNMADQHNDQIADLLCLFSESLFHTLDNLAVRNQAGSP